MSLIETMKNELCLKGKNPTRNLTPDLREAFGPSVDPIYCSLKTGCQLVIKVVSEICQITEGGTSVNPSCQRAADNHLRLLPV